MISDLGNLEALTTRPPDIFVAAIAIAAAQLCPIPDPSFQRSALKEVWDQCVVILEHYKPQVEAASTALHILCILGKRIESLQETCEANSTYQKVRTLTITK
jgi:hypothetical protein